MLPALSTDLFLDSPLIIVIALIAVFGDALLPFLPSGTLVLAASLWVTTHEAGPLWLTAAVAAASVLGDLLVVRLAQGRLRRRPSPAAAARRLEGALREQLGRTTVAARFVPGGRTVLAVAVGASDTSGVSGVSQLRYLGWSAAGGVLWAAYLTGLGHLNSLWFDTAWLGFAVSVLASLVIGACLARALSAPAPSEEKHPDGVRPGAAETPPVRRAEALPYPRRGPHRCTVGSSLAPGAIQRCPRRELIGPAAQDRQSERLWHMSEAPPDRVLPNPLRALAPCATVVTGPLFRPGRGRACIGVRHAVPCVRGPSRPAATRARHRRRTDLSYAPTAR